MATLTHSDLTLEIRFNGYHLHWVQYQLAFLWRGKPLINEALLKRDGPYWGARPDGVLLANESDFDTLIPVLEKVLATEEADYWEPIEPDVTISFHRKESFPFIDSHFELVYESERAKQEREERERVREAAGGRLPDDLFQVMAFVDTYNLDGEWAYSGEGLTLTMYATRQELEQFCRDLTNEYETFCRQHNMSTDRIHRTP